MIRHQKRREYPPARPLSNWAIALGAVIVLAIAVTAWIVLLRRYGGTGASVELDAIRTAGALMVGTGGAFALLLAARRQRSTELTLVHTEHDATERRITELYTKAADQLGSDQAPVRLAGLYALERLAHSTFEHRQTIVDVICAYLRMPYTSPPETPQAGTRYRGPRPRRRRQSLSNDHRSRSVPSPTDRHEQSRQERQVRLTAQDILARNLRLPNESRRRWWTPWRVYREPAWPGIRLNLNRALLLDVNLTNCRIAEADFDGAQFTDAALFDGAQFTGRAVFDGAQFTGRAVFGGAQFTGRAVFDGAQFTDTADFVDAQFTDTADFDGAQFTGRVVFTDAQFIKMARFDGAQFTDAALFDGAQFTGAALFDDARFVGRAHFEDTRFTGAADFVDARFTDAALFDGAQFTGWINFAGVEFTSLTSFAFAQFTKAAVETGRWPPGWTTRPAQPDKGEDPAFRYLVRSEDDPVG